MKERHDVRGQIGFRLSALALSLGLCLLSVGCGSGKEGGDESADAGPTGSVDGSTTGNGSAGGDTATNGGSDGGTGTPGNRPSYGDLSYSIDPASLDVGQAKYNVTGYVSKTIECSGGFFQPPPGDYSTTSDSDKTYFASFWELNGCEEPGLTLYVWKESEDASVSLSTGTYAMGRPAEVAKNDQNYATASPTVSDDHSWTTTDGEVQVTEVTDQQVAGKFKVLLRASFTDIEPPPKAGVEGAFKAERK